jgi:hypothetical protein
MALAHLRDHHAGNRAFLVGGKLVQVYGKGDARPPGSHLDFEPATESPAVTVDW